MSQLRIWIWKSDYPGWNLGFITYQFMTEHLNTKTSLSVKWVDKGGLNKPVCGVHNTVQIQTSVQPFLVPLPHLILLLPRTDNIGKALYILMLKRMLSRELKPSISGPGASTIGTVFFPS